MLYYVQFTFLEILLFYFLQKCTRELRKSQFAHNHHSLEFFMVPADRQEVPQI